MSVSGTSLTNLGQDLPSELSAVSPMGAFTPRRRQRSWVKRTFSNPGVGSVRSSIFSLIVSCVGMGVLVLPFCMKKVGPVCFFLVLGIGYVSSYSSLRICCAAMQAMKAHSYVETLVLMYSERVALCATSMLVVACFGMCCGYLVFASQLAQQLLVVAGVSPNGILDKRWVLVIILACFPVLPVSFYKNLSDFRYLSICSIVGLCYLCILIFYRTPHYLNSSDSTAGNAWWLEIPDVLAIPKCLSLCFTAYVVHMNVFSTYDELADPTGRRITKVIFRSVVAETMLYVAIAFCGFLSFGSRTEDNILQNYSLDDTFGNVGRVFTTYQLLLAVPLTVHPARIYTWPIIVMCRQRNRGNSHDASDPSRSLAGDSFASDGSITSSVSEQLNDIPTSAHIFLTLLFVVSSAFVAAVADSASDLLGIVGGFACMTYAFLMPAEIGNTLRKKHRDGSLVIDWANSPAAFLNGPLGLVAVYGLRICSVIGYIASVKCAYNLITGTK